MESQLDYEFLKKMNGNMVPLVLTPLPAGNNGCHTQPRMSELWPWDHASWYDPEDTPRGYLPPPPQTPTPTLLFVGAHTAENRRQSNCIYRIRNKPGMGALCCSRQGFIVYKSLQSTVSTRMVKWLSVVPGPISYWRDRDIWGERGHRPDTGVHTESFLFAIGWVVTRARGYK